jgi:hypothetical protein
MSIKFKRLGNTQTEPQNIDTRPTLGWLVVPRLTVKDGPVVVRFLPQAEGAEYNWYRDVEVLDVQFRGSGTRGAFTTRVVPLPGLVSKIGRMLYTNEDTKYRMLSKQTREDKAAVKIPSKTRRVFLCTVLPNFDAVFALDAPKAHAGSARPQLGDRLVAFCSEETLNKQIKYGHLADPVDGSAVILTPERSGDYITLNPSVDTKWPMTAAQLAFWEEHYVDLANVVKFSDLQTVLDAYEVILPRDMFELVAPIIESTYDNV